MTRLAVVLFAIAACGCGAPEEAATTPQIPDGIYAVLAVEDEPAKLPPEDAETVALRFDHAYVRGGGELAPEYVLLRTTDAAPLDLAEPPEDGDLDGRPVLLLSLAPRAADALHALTSRAERAAVVVGGEIVTMHRIRVPIEGGLLQVSC